MKEKIENKFEFYKEDMISNWIEMIIRKQGKITSAKKFDKQHYQAAL